ncbi:hypothetical protein AAVH_30935, partial [Aphelenchoides avenae]
MSGDLTRWMGHPLGRSASMSQLAPYPRYSGSTVVRRGPFRGESVYDVSDYSIKNVGTRPHRFYKLNLADAYDDSYHAGRIQYYSAPIPVGRRTYPSGISFDLPHYPISSRNSLRSCLYG